MTSGAGALAALKASVRETPLEPWPMPAEQVLEGDPRASFAVLWQSPDRKRAIGVYECTPGRFTWDFTSDETVCVVEGRATIAPAGGEPFELSAGDIVFFPTGLKTEWLVTETLRDAFSVYSPEGLDLGSE